MRVARVRVVFTVSCTQMLLDLTYVVLSLVLLYYGAELLVGGASGLAIRFGVSPLVVGLTVVAYGTSAPELLVSVQGALAGQGGLSAGNVVGSNIFNTCVILGAAALMKPIGTQLRVLRFDAPLMVLVSLAGLWALSNGYLGRAEAVLLLLGAIAYTVGNYAIGRGDPEQASAADEGPHPAQRPLWVMVVQLLGGLLLLVGGSKLLVTGAVGLATMWGVSEAVIGLTIVAAGTSMPELATSVVAARKGESDIALGNVVGSNLFNILFILGCAGCIHPFGAEGVGRFDLWFMVGTAVVLWPLIWTRHRLGRTEGSLLLASYGAYLWVMWPA